MFAGAVALAGAREAEACGGCFAPPTTVSVVTDHRMVLSLSSQRSVLWDQFRFAGRPAEFSWILPIRYSDAVRVEQADNAFMQAADTLTAPAVQQPPNPCARFAAGGAVDANTSESGGGVVVHREEVVGPYMVAIVGGSDPMAIRNWLRTNGYAVPEAVSPVIDHYTSQSMDFVALRLRPGEGVDRMTPVRVSVPGYMPTLPLRMIAAGVTDRVGLSLIVIADSRVEAQNFPNDEIRATDLVWDWNAPGDPARDYLNAFNLVNERNAGRAWVTESGQVLASRVWDGAVDSVPRPSGASTNPHDDVRIAFEHLGATPFTTRLRADLPARALDRDLMMAARDSTMRPRFYTYGRVLNGDGAGCGTVQPNRGPTITGTPVSNASGATAIATPSPREEPRASGGFECSTRPGSSGSAWWLGAVGLAWSLRRRKRA
jgi:MYXO-CTERM domain-containing protein